MHFDGDVAGGVANFDIAARAGDGNGSAHVGDGDVAPIVANRDGSFRGNLDVHVDRDAAVAGADASGMDFVAVAILNDFDGDRAGAALGVFFVPAAQVLLSRDTDFGSVCGANGNVATTSANDNAGVGRHGFGYDIKVKGIGVAHTMDARPISRTSFGFNNVYADNNADEHEHPDNKKDFAGSNA